MLDLQALEQKTMPIKMLDGKVLNLKKPTQKIFKELQGFNKGGAEERFDNMIKAVEVILNNNQEGINYKTKEIENMIDLELAKIIIEAYMKFVQEVMSNPN